MEDYATRDELNQLGAKVSLLSETCIACRTSLAADVRHLNEELKEAKRDMIEIKQMVQKISEQVNGLTIRVSVIVAIVVGVVNFVAPLLLKIGR